MNDILVIATHQDDEVLGAGGFIAKMARKQKFVNVLILCSGNASRGFTAENEAESEYNKSLNAYVELTGASKEIARRFVTVLQLPDNKLSTVGVGEVANIISEHINRVNPVTVLTHSIKDLNSDHRLTLEAVLIATRPSRSEVMNVYSFEIPSSTEVGFNQFGTFSPDTFVNINRNDIIAKTFALKCYDSENEDFPSTRSDVYLTALAKRRGGDVGINYAEAYETVRSIRNDL